MSNQEKRLKALESEIVAQAEALPAGLVDVLLTAARMMDEATFDVYVESCPIATRPRRWASYKGVGRDDAFWTIYAHWAVRWSDRRGAEGAHEELLDKLREVESGLTDTIIYEASRAAEADTHKPPLTKPVFVYDAPDSGPGIARVDYNWWHDA